MGCSMIAASASAQFGEAAAHPEPRLVKAAHEFEAQLMKELLTPMTHAVGADNDDADSGSGGALADFAAESLGQALSLHGGLGIADGIIRNLSRNDPSSRPFPDPENRESKTSTSLKVEFK